MSARLAPARLAPVRPGPPRSGPPTILIIDDDALDRLFIDRALTKAGDVATLHAESGQAGLRAIREAAPDLVLLDVRMPELDGFDVLDRLGEAAGGEGGDAGGVPPVVMLSTSTDTDEQDQAQRLGAAEWVEKPSSVAGYVATASYLCQRYLNLR